ncbi:MAG TPA: DNA repair protein RecN, partial [Saprospiraceae bacterium]|nr:DNA repair protein RecN [Saprospiraceae bacterium]
MITSLDIHNYAIIDQLHLDFSDGLTIITGETGAGKSILLGALGLIMGERADRKMFYRKDKKCIIEGVFQVKPYQLQHFFDEHELDYEDEVIIRREITVAGKSRAFVNDTPVTLDILRKLTGALIDLHRQFDTQDINDVSFQLRMIDALAGNKDLVKQYAQDYKSYLAKKRELAKLINQNSQAAKELDFLNFQINELAQAELIPDEDTQLETAMKKMDNAASIQATLAKVVNTLNGETQSVQATLRDLASDLARITRFDPKIQEQADILDGLILDFEAVAENLETTLSDTEYSPEEATETRARLDLIYRLQKKHQALNVDGLIEILNNLSDQAKAYTDLEDSIIALQKETEKDRAQLIKKATTLSNKRKKVIPGFEKTVSKGLHELSMPHAVLNIDLQTKEELGPTGLDEVNFLFSANKGGELQPVQGVASGGE